MAAQPTHPLVSSFLRAARFAESSRSANVSILNSWCTFLADRGVELTAATRADAEDFVDHTTARGCGASTVTAKVTKCRGLHTWLVDEGEADVNPWARIKLPVVHETPVQVLDAADYKRLIRTCDRRSTIARRDEAIMSLLWWSGLRRSEICNLDLESLDLHHGTVTVGSRTFSTKTGKVRRVPLAGETVAALDRYLRRRGLDDGPLFLSSRGDDHDDRRLHPNSITTMVNYRATRAGIDRRIGIHEFRRAMAVRHKRAGAGDPGLMAIAGWTSIRMIDRYTRMEREDLAAEEFHRLVDTTAASARRRGRRVS